MRLTQAFLLLACTTVGSGLLAGCSQQTAQEAGYLPVSTEEMEAMPPRPLTVIYGYGDSYVAFPATSPYDCFRKATALWNTRTILGSGEPAGSDGRATCLGEEGVVLFVRKGQAYANAKGKFTPAFASPAKASP